MNSAESIKALQDGGGVKETNKNYTNLSDESRRTQDLDNFGKPIKPRTNFNTVS